MTSNVKHGLFLFGAALGACLSPWVVFVVAVAWIVFALFEDQIKKFFD